MDNIEKIKQITNLKGKCLSQKINDYQQDTKVFFGTGLATTTAPSLGFGIDVLSTILTALEVKRKIGAKQVLHLISTTGYSIGEVTKEELIKKQKEVINTIISNLGITNEYKLICSEDFINTEEFKRIHEQIKIKLSEFYEMEDFEEIGEYTILQTAICKYLYEAEHATVKIGWTTKECEKEESISNERVRELIESGRLNEIYFDSIYRYVYPNDECSYIYTPAALGLDGRCSPPYTVTEKDNRPLIDESILRYYNEYISNKDMSRDARKKLRKSIENIRRTIVEPYERIYGEIIINDKEKTPDDPYIVVIKLNKIQEILLRERLKNNDVNDSMGEPGGK